MDQVRDTTSLIGKGVYSAAEAGRLTGVSAARIGRWLSGRRRTYKGDEVFDRPLWSPELPDVDGQISLSFRDLVEVRMIDGFRRQGLSLPYLRKVVDAARAFIDDNHPFTSSMFKTDGKRVYYEVLSGTDEPKLIEVLRGQHVFHSIISVGLRDIEFEHGVVVRWRPEAGREDVVLDPQRSFGQPILAVSGISTAIIRLVSEHGRTPKEIARDFEIPERAVRSALAFEAKLAA